MKQFKVTLRLTLALTLLICALPAGARASAPEQADQAEELLAQMTPAEKVGQLFLVTFNGTDVDPDSELYDLITNWHVGGFVLRADQDNFVDVDTTLAAQSLITSMQSTAWEKTQPLPDTTPPQPTPVYIPLYIGIEQGGSGNDQILSGLTPLPNQMSLGATWSPELAEEVGQVMGSELAALGFNLYLGPTLDVADTANLEAARYAGPSLFGGDQYWVGELGQAYVAGLHSGSQGRLSVIARNFPGLGSADRSPEEEVSTVRKSLEQLKQIELAPFFTVTSAEDPASQVDGLMIAHIRFQGFQGNIRATTRPVSFDATALEQLLAVEPLATWRAAGGLTVSNSLGSRAVRNFFDPTGQTFDAFNIARTAFLAGNDLLYLHDFKAPLDESAYETITRTLQLFASKYEEDTVFAKRVDAAVLRILRAKLKLYGSFSPETIIPNPTSLANLGQAEEINFNVAREAVTLISPSPEDFKALLPSPPEMYDQIIIFTDERTQRQCSNCQLLYDLPNFAFQNTLLRLYGPSGSNQILANRLNSYTFKQLIDFLGGNTEGIDPYLSSNLNRAQWVIFNIKDLDPDLPETYALRRMLAERFDLLREKKIIVFSYDAPYYLDATEISKLSAYYGLYSSSQAFIDVAARVLMQEVQPTGSLPVSLPAVGYDLLVITSPDPNQVIPITLVSPREVPQSTPSGTETPTGGETSPVPLFVVGETVKIQAGVIHDHNQHIVPDGTVVQFTIRIAGDQAIIAQPQATTVDGIATIEYRIERDGIFEVTASSEPANTSGILILNTQGGLAQLIMPTPTPTNTPTPTPTLTPTYEVSPITTETPPPNPSGYPDMIDWFMTLIFMALGFGAAYATGRFWWGSQQWGIRSGLCALIGGFSTYLLLTLGIGGLEDLVREGGTWFIVEVTLFGMLIGWVAALLWWMTVSNPPSSTR